MVDLPASEDATMLRPVAGVSGEDKESRDREKCQAAQLLHTLRVWSP